ncbi:cation:proton antiporter [Deinococcus altitudinis]|uniref:cation:proton antiporter domain-containing protein n=1 Tax=Deinococcus altitudinis TaxID=468914 RepID=UPI003891DB5B
MGVLPTFLLTVFGSIAVGWVLMWPISWLIGRIDDAPTAVIFQFVSTFAAWLLAEHLGLSAVVTVVVFGLTSGRRTAEILWSRPSPSGTRSPSPSVSSPSR